MAGREGRGRDGWIRGRRVRYRMGGILKGGEGGEGGRE